MLIVLEILFRGQTKIKIGQSGRVHWENWKTMKNMEEYGSILCKNFWKKRKKFSIVSNLGIFPFVEKSLPLDGRIMDEWKNYTTDSPIICCTKLDLISFLCVITNI